MKIIVNSGTVGTPAALDLARMGNQVTLTVRTAKPNADWDKLGIRQVPTDINDLESLTRALTGGEALFSVTPLVDNLVAAGTLAVRAAQKAGIRKIVRMSAQSAGPNATIQLGRWHYALEKAVEDSGIPFTILRPANFMQNYLTFGTPETIKKQNVFYSPLGEAKISVIDTRDISAVATRVLVERGHDGKHYDLTGPESLSNHDIATILTRALDRKITYVAIPQDKAVEAMAGSGMPGWLVEMLSELNRFGAAGNLAAIKPDTGLILKREPIQFSQFVQDHLAAFNP